MQSSLRLSLAGASLSLVALCAGAVHALDPATTDPKVIFKAATKQSRGERSESRVKMTIHDHAGARERILTLRSKRIEQANKSLILIEAPADVRNTGFLSIDYDNGGRADEQWLYLPKLHRVTRVPNSGKSDSFVGSDFSYADMSARDADDFDLKLLEASVRVGEDDCWLVEAVPRTPKIAEETGYKKTQLWVSKQKLVPLQMKAWLNDGAHVKYLKASDVRMIDGLYTPHRMQMRTMHGNELQSETVLEVLAVSNDAKDVSDEDFTQQRLERGL